MYYIRTEKHYLNNLGKIMASNVTPMKDSKNDKNSYSKDEQNAYNGSRKDKVKKPRRINKKRDQE
jgi:hypothetical protein